MIPTAELKLDSSIESIVRGPYEPLLRACIDLSRRCYLAPAGPFAHPWLDIGPGYFGHPCWGHWDIVHECVNLLPFAPEVVRRQIEMALSLMGKDGMLPATVWGPRPHGLVANLDPHIWSHEGEFRWRTDVSCAPLLAVLIDDYFRRTGDRAFLRTVLPAARKNLRWWRTHRGTSDGGFYYADILGAGLWESGVDKGVRFDHLPQRPHTCIDATCHVLLLMTCVRAWAGELGEGDASLDDAIESARCVISQHLWNERSGFFHDAWVADDHTARTMGFEGFFPLLAGAATGDQACRLRDHLMNPAEFFTYHPVATVSADSPSFELDCWRGPAWNSMTYWIVRGLMNYGFIDEAAAVAHRALQRTQEIFLAEGTIAEFYNSKGPELSVLRRKGRNTGPCRDYLGHAPLLAMWMLIR